MTQNLCDDCETVTHCSKYGCIPKRTGSIKKTNDNMALVDVTHHWTIIDKANPPPTGIKLLLINRNLGVAVIVNYKANSTWTHYAGLPTFRKNT